MLIYKDIITGDELLSDSYDLKFNGAVIEADCAMIVEGEVEINIGANASAEETEETGGNNEVMKVNNIVHSFRLQSTNFDKKSYKLYIKGYLKRVRAKLVENGATEEAIKTFEKETGEFYTQTLIPDFAKYEFFTGESMDPDGMVVLLNYRPDNVTPYVIIWKHGVEAMKV
ncbi:hypothetical protein QQX98_008349 [Neonectria punicea]|uniref:Translationally-controlled tumor protein homolog n=1 Tax=Neonectria punicea TaxID=979145 RepID=A0ABR1GVP5_9HYPO